MLFVCVLCKYFFLIICFVTSFHDISSHFCSDNNFHLHLLQENNKGIFFKLNHLNISEILFKWSVNYHCLDSKSVGACIWIQYSILLGHTSDQRFKSFRFPCVVNELKYRKLLKITKSWWRKIFIVVYIWQESINLSCDMWLAKHSTLQLTSPTLKTCARPFLVRVISLWPTIIAVQCLLRVLVE